MPSSRAQSIAVFAFFAVFLAVGLAIYQDYGVSWDGPAQRNIGGANVRYICEQTQICEVDDFLRKFPTLPNLRDRDYGPIHEIILMTVEWHLGLTDPRDVYSMRHLLNFLFFLIGSLAFYRFVADVTTKKIYGLLAVALLALSPRIFAHAFFNTKDLTFLSAMLICLYTMNKYFRQPCFRTALLHGVATGIAIDLRIMGVVILCCTLGVAIIDCAKRPSRFLGLFGVATAYLLSTIATVFLFFPHLWHKPGANFVAAFSAMSSFRWESVVKVSGELLWTTSLPWYYIPIWIAVSIPFSFLVFICLGTIGSLAMILNNRITIWENHKEQMTAICLVLFLGPVIAVIALGSVLYDGWRQMFFIYPAGIFLGVMFVKKAIKFMYSTSQVFGNAAVAMLALILAKNLGIMIATHPHQNAYFNWLVSEDPSKNFDNDYWGISNKQALETLLESDKSTTITIGSKGGGPINTAVLKLGPNERARLKDVSVENRPQYILTNYRGDVSTEVPWLKGYEEVSSIVVLGDKINSTFKRQER